MAQEGDWLMPQSEHLAAMLEALRDGPVEYSKLIRIGARHVHQEQALRTDKRRAQGRPDSVDLPEQIRRGARQVCREVLGHAKQRGRVVVDSNRMVRLP